MEIILAIILGFSLVCNVVSVPLAIKGIKIEVNTTQYQTTITEVEKKKKNENINTVTVYPKGYSLTNIITTKTNYSTTNTSTNISSITNYIIK